MIYRMRVDGALPGSVPEPARLLGRCVQAGLPTAPATLLLEVPEGTDAELVCALGPLPPGLVDLVALGAGPDAVVPDLPVDDLRSLAAGVRTARLLGGPILVQPVVPSVHAGQARLRAATTVDVVLAVEGRAHEIRTAAEVRRLEMPVLRRRQRAHRGADEWRTPLPPWGMRLSRLLRDLRRVLPELDVDATWSDDGAVCRLLGVGRAG